MKTPREVRNGLRYVFQNARKHHVLSKGLDPCSSARWFDGWKSRLGLEPGPFSPVTSPFSWLLHTGWRRHGLISLSEVPTS